MADPIPGKTSKVVFLKLCGGHRHGLALDRVHSLVGVGRLEPEEPVIALYWVLVGAARACPVAPETGEHKERLALIKHEPDPDLLANDGVHGIRRFAEGGCRLEAAVG